jgi:hypothetical protein
MKGKKVLGSWQIQADKKNIYKNRYEVLSTNPRSINQYEVQNLTEPQTGPDIPRPVNNKRSEVRTRGVPGKIKKKIIIIGDSHATVCG